MLPVQQRIFMTEQNIVNAIIWSCNVIKVQCLARRFFLWILGIGGVWLIGALILCSSKSFIGPESGLILSLCLHTASKFCKKPA